jgi:hypothetical protein
MAVTSKALFRGAASTSSATLYTVPSSTTAVVTNIVVDNTSASDQTFSITLDGVDLISAAPIAANASAFFDLKQAIATTQTITGLASATSVTFHISGVEIS